MLNLIHYEPRSVEVAARHALLLLDHTDIPLPTLSDCNAAIATLCSSGAAAIVDLGLQNEISNRISSFGGFGPTDGIPFLGQLDFTLAGAELWRSILNFETPEMGVDYYWHNTLSFSYRRNATILTGFDLDWVLRDAKLCEFEPMEQPEQIGVWRSQWWREIPSGFRLRCPPVLA